MITQLLPTVDDVEMLLVGSFVSAAAPVSESSNCGHDESFVLLKLREPVEALVTVLPAEESAAAKHFFDSAAAVALLALQEDFVENSLWEAFLIASLYRGQGR